MRSKKHDNTWRDILILTMLLVFGIYGYYVHKEYKEHRQIDKAVVKVNFKDMDDKLDVAIALASMNLAKLEELKLDMKKGE